MTYKCFISLSALQSVLLRNLSQLTNLGGSRGHVGTEAWVGVSPQALWLHVGWNSLLSADYCFVKTNIFFFQWATPSRSSLFTKSWATLVGLALIWDTTGFSPHAKASWTRRKSADIQTEPAAIGLLHGRIHFYISAFHCITAKAPLTLHLHMLCIYC